MPKHNRSRAGQFISTKEKNRRDKVSLCRKNESSDTDEVDCCVGRRLVNIKHLGLEMWCLSCDVPLSFRDVEDERRQGLLSVFYVRCRICLVLKAVSTDTKTATEDQNLNDVNHKAVIAMIDTGIGPTQFNTLLSALNIPNPSKNLYKRYERKIEPVLESLADESCREAIELEKSLTQQSPLPRSSTPVGSSENMEVDSTIVNIAASYDMGWQRRGNGKSFDSLTGHGSLIGLHSKKVLNFGMRSKACRKCSAENPKSCHDCRMNFCGSAKSMEADVAMELVNSENFKKSGVQIGVFIGDDDSSTISAIRRSAGNHIMKWSDINHAKKGLGNMLYRLQKSNKNITSSVIKYLKKCFGYALEQNRNNEEETKKAILNIVDHAFDEHVHCGDWCKYKLDPVNYKHIGLPGGKGLKGESSYDDLKKLL